MFIHEINAFAGPTLQIILTECSALKSSCQILKTMRSINCKLMAHSKVSQLPTEFLFIAHFGMQFDLNLRTVFHCN